MDQVLRMKNMRKVLSRLVADVSKLQAMIDEVDKPVDVPLEEGALFDLASNGLRRREDAEVAIAAETAAVVASPELLMQMWNGLTDGPIPQCRALTGKRLAHAKARLRGSLQLANMADTVSIGNAWETIIRRVVASDFCNGKNDRGWVATFDWLVSSDDVPVKVLEGKYDNRDGVKTARVVQFSARENEAARTVRRAWGRCMHKEHCENQVECLTKIMTAARGK